MKWPMQDYILKIYTLTIYSLDRFKTFSGEEPQNFIQGSAFSSQFFWRLSAKDAH
jgi:hypothetical protein